MIKTRERFSLLRHPQCCRCRKYLCQLSEVPGGGGDEEFVFCPYGPRNRGRPRPGMREEHFDLLPQLHRDGVLFGIRKIAGRLACVFMHFADDGSKVHIGAATCL